MGFYAFWYRMSLFTSPLHVNVWNVNYRSGVKAAFECFSLCKKWPQAALDENVSEKA